MAEHVQVPLWNDRISTDEPGLDTLLSNPVPCWLCDSHDVTVACVWQPPDTPEGHVFTYCLCRTCHTRPNWTGLVEQKYADMGGEAARKEWERAHCGHSAFFLDELASEDVGVLDRAALVTDRACLLCGGEKTEARCAWIVEPAKVPFVGREVVYYALCDNCCKRTGTHERAIPEVEAMLLKERNELLKERKQ